MLTRKILIVLSLAALVLPALAITPFAGAQENKPTAVGLRPDAPTYAVHGPYAVGARDFVIDPDTEQPLTITIWYPALNPEGMTEDITYSLAANSSVKLWTPPDTTIVTKGRAIQDAAPDKTKGPYPLVLFSHGLGGWRSANAFLLEHLASWGFVVIAPDHPGESGSVSIWASYITRPKDMQRAINYADSLTAAGGALEGMIDTAHIAAVGHSFGGNTILSLGGAQIDWAGVQTLCTEHSEADISGTWCPDMLPREADLAALAGLSSVPEDLWPSTGDPRVKAIISLTGNEDLFVDNGLAGVTVPVMVQVGTMDSINPPQWNAYPTYDHVSSKQKALVEFENGGHTIFFDQCADIQWAVDLGLFWLCSDSVWDMNRAHDLINHFSTAFLLSVLKGDKDATAALAADKVSFPGIMYTVQGF